MRFLISYRFPIFIGLIVIFIIQSCTAQPVNTIEEKRFEKVIDTLSNLLNQYYVFPDVAKKIEEHLKQQLVKEKFKGISSNTEFAERLTLEMGSIAHDLHLQCRYRNFSFQQKSNRSNENPNDDQKIGSIKEFGFIRTGKINRSIGYLEILGFPSPASAKESFDDAMKTISDSKVLIIDLRRNGGGSPEMIKYVCSYFFDKSTHINSIYWRNLNKTVDYITLDKVDGKKMSQVPIYLLTSTSTVSGGEEFAYDMQTQKRGILIGEVTAGGANPGDVFSLDNDFTVFIPTGRAINPITKTNWEGVGVKPDMEVNAQDALSKAIIEITSQSLF